MDLIRYVSAPLKITFDIDENLEEHKREYDSLSSSDDDSVGEWLRLAKARGETGESDQVLLTLVVELHRKIDDLNSYIRGEKTELIGLLCKGDIEAINYEYFRVKEELFEKDRKYYGRVEMPFFPKREVPIYFKAVSKNEAKIVLLHERDEKDWNAYVVARERIMIREMRANKDGI
ncbi:hypothetical protein [Sulfurospirillum arcachonense]|uniref:hypothetical protein n=1 Tax=Sulfurospirillum arcachonense TaxID=57666 RepID=UPI000468F9F2|nr:hypothetical protein [Sulfurospirillum arcachonense]